jgi:hypothetical protein
MRLPGRLLGSRHYLTKSPVAPAATGCQLFNVASARNITVSEDNDRFRLTLSPETMQSIRQAKEAFEQMVVAVHSFATSPPPVVLELKRSLHQLRDDWTKVARGVADAVAASREVWLPLLRIGYAYQRLDQSGWLPHHTTPFHLIEQAGDSAEAVGDVLQRFYKEEWPAVSAAFSEKLDTFSIDEEAKSAFREALAVHEHGHYRASCRLLFPEAERVSRMYIDPDRTGASVMELRKLAGELTPGETGGAIALKHFAKLTEHLYAKVESPEALDV